MDHSEAIQLGAAERYLLGDLAPEQRDQFEEHFFSCQECASEVRSGAVFVDNARQLLREVPARQIAFSPSKQRRHWVSWLQPAWGLAAVFAMLAVISYQNLVTIPKLKQVTSRPEALTSFSLIAVSSRSGGAAVIHPRHDRPFGIYVDIPAIQPFPYYTLQVATGHRHYEVQVTGDQAKDTVQMLIPAGALDAGKAELIIDGRPSQDGPVTEIARDPFEIQYQ